jgi:hypothetical protein
MDKLKQGLNFFVNFQVTYRMLKRDKHTNQINYLDYLKILHYLLFLYKQNRGFKII